MANGRVVARIIATQDLTGEGEASTADGDGDVKAGLLQTVVKFGQQAKVLNGTDKAWCWYR